MLLFAAGLAADPPGAPEGMVVLSDDGGWCWFEDERAIFAAGKLIIGAVASGAHDAERRGDIEAIVYDPATGETRIAELHDRMQLDDHDSPALMARPDGRLLAVYAKHGPENHFYYRITKRPADPAEWGPERTFTPSETSRITYSNLFFLSAENGGNGRIYNFFRGLDNSFKPSYAYSDDYGESWKSGNVFIDLPTSERHRPYVKYASNGIDTIHLFYTDGHPRVYDNSAYHAFYRRGRLYRSDGTAIGLLQKGLRDPAQGTVVFAGDADNVAWVSDIHLDAEGNPYVAYSVQRSLAGEPRGEAGQDHRYRYARWSGSEWLDHEIAYAGTRLYAGEDDYTGNIALDPDDPDTVYISTNADPTSGEALISKADGRRHWEIFRGLSDDGGAHWKWESLTRNSSVDNIRPIVPKSDGRSRAVLWLRGAYRAYTDYDLDVVGIIRPVGAAR